jgi:pSer/pThr/pTyr-binding forkhead associated (FHA) protein
MSQEALQRFTEGTSFEGDASRIQDLGERVLERLLHPPDPAVATGLGRVSRITGGGRVWRVAR